MKLRLPALPRPGSGLLTPGRAIALGLLIMAAAMFAAASLATDLFLTAGGEPREAVFLVAPGESFAQVAQSLEDQGLIHDARAFLLLAKLTGSGGRLRAGEFAVDAGWYAPRVLEQLTRGQPILHRLQVREGLSWWETGRLVEEAGLGSFESFARAVRDKELLARYNIPFDTAEGFLFPETYSLPRPADNDARPVVEAMLKEFFRVAREVWPEGLPAPAELARTVTLASIVEKETGQGGERTTVAGVYANRLRIGMLLQADPTVIYGIGPSFDGNLRRADLDDTSNPYNTYRHAGLPPGPICSPGRLSLLAAAHPEDTKFLYFVSRGDGTHVFSTNLEDHNRAVRRFQLSHH
ncbi:aminodeoxychorismate lyase [Desulfovibrio sp. X2]|uniref:endolytic transglycosylase MltG n=1 Tax=Desulfovibrio sp. X2 TaxID=941449 RepID=UPI0003589B4B|nr:endolytic transglycosylase MltG [Desulfovibrio sp. X2]EPR38662.1 aminodeoxychorismate lyase [Desulfovibrio sp. X2]